MQNNFEWFYAIEDFILDLTTINISFKLKSYFYISYYAKYKYFDNMHSNFRLISLKYKLKFLNSWETSNKIHLTKENFCIRKNNLYYFQIFLKKS